MPWPESWPKRDEDAAFADSATEVERARLEANSAAESANATFSRLIGHDSSHGISDVYHRSG